MGKKVQTESADAIIDNCTEYQEQRRRHDERSGGYKPERNVVADATVQLNVVHGGSRQEPSPAYHGVHSRSANRQVRSRPA